MTTKAKKWNTETFGNTIEIIDGDRGVNYPKQNEFSDSGYCLFLNTKNVPANSFVFDEKMFISEEKDTKLRKGKLTQGDFVLTTRGTVGNFAYYSDKIPFENMRINSGMVILRPKKDGKILSNFFRFYLDSPQFKGQIKSHATGSAQPQLPIRDLSVFKILFPDTLTQQQIANVLTVYDGLIENNTRRIKILEQMAKAIYTEWFYSKKKSPNISKVGNLSDVGEILKDKFNEDTDQNLPLVDMARMRIKSLSISELGKSTDLSTSRIIFEEDDILFGSIRSYLHKVTLAPFKGITNTSVFVFRPKDRNLSSFLTITLFREETIAWANQYSTGTKMPVIKGDLFLTMPIQIPAEIVLKKFEEIVSPMLKEIKYLTLQNLNLKQSRDLLLPKLVTGEIKV